MLSNSRAEDCNWADGRYGSVDCEDGDGCQAVFGYTKSGVKFSVALGCVKTDGTIIRIGAERPLNN